VFLKEFKALPYYHTNGIDITNLKPFTWYTIKFRRNAQQWERRFRTGEGIPQKVKNLVVIDKSSSSVRVKWKEPMINGKFEHYVVQYGVSNHDERVPLLTTNSSVRPPLRVMCNQKIHQQ
jgi:hypothetical protein